MLTLTFVIGSDEIVNEHYNNYTVISVKSKVFRVGFKSK
jgi:hypothetical protein